MITSLSCLNTTPWPSNLSKSKPTGQSSLRAQQGLSISLRVSTERSRHPADSYSAGCRATKPSRSRYIRTNPSHDVDRQSNLCLGAQGYNTINAIFNDLLPIPAVWASLGLQCWSTRAIVSNGSLVITGITKLNWPCARHPSNLQYETHRANSCI